VSIFLSQDQEQCRILRVAERTNTDRDRWPQEIEYRAGTPSKKCEKSIEDSRSMISHRREKIAWGRPTSL
jgi:hypothetical protein